MTGFARSLSMVGLTKTYGDFVAVRDISLEIEQGKFVTLLGPSGSGKTTLLMMIAGFTLPSAGRIRVDDRDITDVPPEKRNFGMVFQGYALFPHMTVRQNVAFPLRLRRVAPAERDATVARTLDLVQLGPFSERRPRELSGGQQQRVALARALVFRPDLLLLDEPLSALDKKLRSDLQGELRHLHRKLGTTFVYVTHDQEEALSMSDEIVIMNRGRIVQRGTPEALYESPASHFVADFLGRTNFIEGRVVSRSGGEAAYQASSLTFRQAGLRPESALADGSDMLVGIRPEKMRLAAPSKAGNGNTLPGTIKTWAYLGAEFHVTVATAIGDMHIRMPAAQGASTAAEGRPVTLAWLPEDSVVLEDDRRAG
jgi:putative spermidine/putrescine transport system ATP-binding protein